MSTFKSLRNVIAQILLIVINFKTKKVLESNKRLTLTTNHSASLYQHRIAILTSLTFSTRKKSKCTHKIVSTVYFKRLISHHSISATLTVRKSIAAILINCLCKVPQTVTRYLASKSHTKNRNFFNINSYLNHIASRQTPLVKRCLPALLILTRHS